MSTDRIWKEGLAAGLLGYAAVVALFLVWNLAVGRPAFYTPAALGGAIFFGLREGAEVAIEPGPVIAYNGLHMLLSMLLGVISAFVVVEAERHRDLWYAAFFVFLSLGLYLVLLVGVFAVEVAHVLSWPAVVAGTLAGGGATLGYLWTAHRGLPGLVGQELAA